MIQPLMEKLLTRIKKSIKIKRMNESMNLQTHFFYAVKIPEDIKLTMKKNGEKLKEILPFSRWVHYQDLHITLAFLGNAPTEKLVAADYHVREEIQGLRAFELQINKLGIFGKEDSPRIFWADTKESNELGQLRKKVFTACEQAGFKLESRPFRPHITLARKWAGGKPFHKDLLAIWKEVQSEPLTFTASEVVLYQTHLEKTPKYEAKTVYSLI
jgi:RNA 2',3'-cyclic 3'-phosphodiesterase